MARMAADAGSGADGVFGSLGGVLARFYSRGGYIEGVAGRSGEPSQGEMSARSRLGVGCHRLPESNDFTPFEPVCGD